jgi:isoleucyl-tRNA synthetase
MAVDQNIIAKLDLNITPDLQREGVAREISRFLNQMRKDADYNVDDKVKALYSTTDEHLKNILNEFEKFFKNEALISEFVPIENPEGDVVALFTNNEANINFALKK